MTDLVPAFSFFGMALLGISAALGLYIIARGAFVAARVAWGVSSQIDRAVENDFKIRIGR